MSQPSPPPIANWIQADLTWIDGRFEPNVAVSIDASGRIAQVAAVPAAPPRRLASAALLPGFVNVHSHAFQRELRGQGETYPAGRGDFWSWRESMYALVEQLPAERVRAAYALAFQEMLVAGYTSVGEFHYLRHSGCDAYDFALDELILDAAHQAGIRLVLLLTYYETGAIGQPLNRAQQRFATRSVADFIASLERLAPRLRPEQSLAIAPHSVRAVPPAALRELFAAAAERGVPCHIHLEEQQREQDDCRAAFGVAPMRWVLERAPVGPNCTAIHATHAEPQALDDWLAAGARVCVCPITEGNLGDGLADLPRVLTHAGRLCIGSDSNIRLDPFEELRWLEFVQRLRAEKRGIARRSDGDLAAPLIEIGTCNGAAALGLAAGRIAPGQWADFCVLDLTHPELRGWTPETLATHAIFGGSAACVREVCVGGAWQAVCV